MPFVHFIENMHSTKKNLVSISQVQGFMRLNDKKYDISWTTKHKQYKNFGPLLGPINITKKNKRETFIEACYRHKSNTNGKVSIKQIEGVHWW
jgi:hypothetical protein